MMLVGNIIGVGIDDMRLYIFLDVEVEDGRGLEAWRRVHKEWQNKSPQVMETYRLAYT